MAWSEIEVDPRGWSSRTQVSITVVYIHLFYRKCVPIETNELIYFYHRDTVTVCISPSPTVYKIIQDLPWSGCVHITSGPKTKVSPVTTSCWHERSLSNWWLHIGQSLIIFKLDLQVNLAYKILINLFVFHRMKYFVWHGFFRKCKSRSGQNWVTASPSWPRVLSLCLNTPPVPPSVCPTSPVWGAWCRHPPTR